MSSILRVGSYLPSPVKFFLRVAAPIAVNYGIQRFIPIRREITVAFTCITLLIVTTKISTLEKVAVALIYVAYRFFYNRYLLPRARAESLRPHTPLNMSQVADACDQYDLSLASSSAISATPLATPLGILEEQFQKVLGYLTFISDNPAPCNIRRVYFEETPEAINRMFQLAETDMNNLYEELLKKTEAEQPEKRDRAMAELLMDKTKPFYARFCDPSKPTLWFFYPLVRGCVYYTRQSNNTRQSHAFALENPDLLQFFTDDTSQARWRKMYHAMIDKWSHILPYLPQDSEIAERTLKDNLLRPASDASPEKVFKIHQPKLLLGLQ